MNKLYDYKERQLNNKLITLINEMRKPDANVKILSEMIEERIIASYPKDVVLREDVILLQSVLQEAIGCSSGCVRFNTYGGDELVLMSRSSLNKLIDSVKGE